MLIFIATIVVFNTLIIFSFLKHVTDMNIEIYSKLYAEIKETKEILKSYIDFEFDMMANPDTDWLEISEWEEN